MVGVSGPEQRKKEMPDETKAKIQLNLPRNVLMTIFQCDFVPKQTFPSLGSVVKKAIATFFSTLSQM